jgi:hypothetical protein
MDVGIKHNIRTMHHEKSTRKSLRWLLLQYVYAPGSTHLHSVMSISHTCVHVGFYCSEYSDAFHILGGNQSNSVSATRISKQRLLTAR